MGIYWGRLHTARIFIITFVLTFGITDFAVAKVFFCASGDVDCLVDSIGRANERAGAHRIILEAGTYAFTAADNAVDTGPRFGGNALPSITNRVTINGAGTAETIIDAGGLRAFHIATTGNVTLHGLTIQGGGAEAGGAIFNRGTLVLLEMVLRDNLAAFGGGGGGIFNLGTLRIVDSLISQNFAAQADNGGIASTGPLTILRSTIDQNLGEDAGGIRASGPTTIEDSTISDNFAFLGGGGGLLLSGVTTITNTTIAGNVATFFSGGGLWVVGGTVLLTNVTVADNHAGEGSARGGGIGVFAGTVLLQNSIVARNTQQLFIGPPAPDCLGPITSLGNNIIGNTADCTIDLASTDFVGDPGLGEFTDNETPGGGYIPLLAESPAIDAANRIGCPRHDQLGNRRADGDGDGRRFCDIGATEFIPSQ